MKKKDSLIFKIILVLLFFCPVYFFGQATGTPDPLEPADISEGPMGFRGFKLGMTVDQVKSLLLEDLYFDYRGEPDVSFMPETTQVLIECEGFSFIDRAYFQFNDGKLYILILVLNEDKVDHYSLFTTLIEKYGDFTSLDPLKVEWQLEKIRLFLERPLSVKYVDIEVFNRITEQGEADEQERDLSRQQFLDQF